MNRPDKEASSPAACQSSRSILWLENIAKTIDWIVIPLNKKFRFITRMVLALMILYVVLDVLMRLIFSSSLIGTIEIQEFALVIIAFLGFAPEESDRNHIRVELFLQFLPKWVTALLGSAHPEREHFEILVKNLARPNLFLTINQET